MVCFVILWVLGDIKKFVVFVSLLMLINCFLGMGFNIIFVIIFFLVRLFFFVCVVICFFINGVFI